MGGWILAIVGLDFHDHPADTRHKEGRANEFRRDRVHAAVKKIASEQR
jgi:hypothetical protein